MVIRRHRLSLAIAMGGFTLIELLIIVTAGLLLMAALTPVIISEIRSGLKNEKFLNAQQDFLRLTSFIESEVGEGSRLAYNQATPGCTPSGSSIVSVTIPYGFNSTTLLPDEVTVHYYVSGNSLYRCGPPILSTGALSPTGAISTSLLSSNTLVTVGSASNSKGLDYTLEVRNENNELIFSQASGSRTRAGIIDN